MPVILVRMYNSFIARLSGVIAVTYSMICCQLNMATCVCLDEPAVS